MSELAGFEQLDRKLLALGDAKQIKNVARNGIRAGLRVVVAGIKSKIPGQYKDARKAIGSTLKKTKFGENSGQVAAKVGAGVGKKLAAAATKARRRKGVGIQEGGRNMHWFILGTGDRKTGGRTYRVKGGRIDKKTGKRRGVAGIRRTTTGNPVRPTGRMPAVMAGIVQAGVAASSSEAVDKIKANMAAGIQKLAK